MKDTDIPGKVNGAMRKLCYIKGYAAPVEVLMEMGVLSKKDYEDWRRGNVRCLEAVCHCNLSKLSKIMKAIRRSAQENGWKPSVTVYNGWGKHRKGVHLRFSKTGNPDIEQQYSTHYVDAAQIKRLKEEKELRKKETVGQNEKTEKNPNNAWNSEGKEIKESAPATVPQESQKTVLPQ